MLIKAWLKERISFNSHNPFAGKSCYPQGGSRGDRTVSHCWDNVLRACGPLGRWEGRREDVGRRLRGFRHGCRERGVLRTELGFLPDGPAKGAARSAHQPCGLPGKERQEDPGAPRAVSPTSLWCTFLVQPSPAGALSGAGDGKKGHRPSLGNTGGLRALHWESWEPVPRPCFQASPCPSPGLSRCYCESTRENAFMLLFVLN